MAPERFTPNLPTMSRIMEKLSGQIKPARHDAVLFLSTVAVIRLHLHISPCKYTLRCGRYYFFWFERRPELRRENALMRKYIVI